MLSQYCQLQQMNGVWVTIYGDKMRPSTPTELYLWNLAMELREEAAANLSAAALCAAMKKSGNSNA